MKERFHVLGTAVYNELFLTIIFVCLTLLDLTDVNTGWITNTIHVIQFLDGLFPHTLYS
jgi:hypothetical protein